MKQKIYQIDAFADKVFAGNPAAVCPLEKWLNDDVLQNIAMENNLAETAFYVNKGEHYEIRWFTPAVEVDLCGHATLAAAYVLFYYEGHSGDKINFHSHRSGVLTVTKKADQLTLNFPTDTLQEIKLSEQLSAGFNIKPKAVYKGKTDYMFVFNSESDISNINVDLDKVAKLEARGVIITAKGDKVDFVSRFFAPQVGINEDPVTGSAHTSLTPYWAKQLGKTDMSAIQLSARKGYLHCKFLEDRVEISGQGKLYLVGEIFIR
jgi:PhzF family phenazine biosynthesis protein